MTRLRSLAVALTFIAASSGQSLAQMPGMPGGSRPISLIVSGGLTVPAGDLGDFHDSGFHYDVSLLVTLPGFPIALRPEISLTQFKLKDPIGGGGLYDGDVTKMFAAMGNIELPIFGGLYVLAGGGLLSLTTPDASGGEDLSESKFTFDAGAGFRFAMGPVRGYLEARIGSASYEQGTFGFSKAQFIPITFGLVF